VVSLRGWSDVDIMECDLRRLNLAIEAAQKADIDEWRERYRIAGWKVEAPADDPDDDEAFNEQLRSTIALFRK
jgi:hypothetical protein